MQPQPIPEEEPAPAPAPAPRKTRGRKPKETKVPQEPQEAETPPKPAPKRAPKRKSSQLAVQPDPPAPAPSPLPQRTTRRKAARSPEDSIEKEPPKPTRTTRATKATKAAKATKTTKATKNESNVKRRDEVPAETEPEPEPEAVPEPEPEPEAAQATPMEVDKTRGGPGTTSNSKKIALPFSDTPIINRNKEMRKKTGGRRSSLGMRGRRASSLLDSGNSAIPHREVDPAEFYKHIEADGPSEPRRMKQLLMWCGERALAKKPKLGSLNSNAVLGGKSNGRLVPP